MKKLALSLLLLFLMIIPFGCQDMNDVPLSGTLEIKDFVWRGMNTYYLWQADVPNLADNRFGSQSQRNDFLNSYPSAYDLFNALRIDKSIDRFSSIYSDYSVLEGVLSGNTLDNGMEYGLRYKPGSTTDVYGWVRYILPNSNAATQNVVRGEIFYAIDETPLTVSNYRELLARNAYTLYFADYNNGSITPNGKSVALTKSAISENPVLINRVIVNGAHNIGYLMYNGFYPDYDNQLNAAFGNFASQNVTDLVLDLRYNPGGSVTTAVKLASMITGQFTGQLFGRQQWNAKAQKYYGSVENKFVGGVSSLNLNKVYILTSAGTASASELVINCLKPYITVVQIGDKTIGKNVGSITLYDSPTFSKKNVNPNHKYAMQPIVFKIVNKDGFGDYAMGISPLPSLLLVENIENLGTLGSPDEPLLSAAITQIVTGSRKMPANPRNMERDFIDAKTINPLRSEMYLERE